MPTRLFLLLLTCLLIPGAYAQDQDDLLPPEEAFRFTAAESEPGVLTASWSIAEGYYLYRSKFKFNAGDNTQLAEAKIPPGKIKNDEFFGEIETYRDHLDISIPFSRENPNGNTLELEAVYQGCADLGVCYPPQKITLPIQLAQADTGTKKGAFGILSDLTSGIGGDEPELLDPDKAFAFSAELEGPGTLVAEWIVAEGYYLYKDKIKMALQDASGLNLGDPEFPASTRLDDPQYGDVEIFRGPVTVKFPVLGLNGQPDALGLKAGYQGCADIGVCYPPIKKSINFAAEQLSNLVSSPAVAAEESSEPATTSAPNLDSTSESGKVSEQDAIAAKLSSGNMPLTLLSFFGFGLLLAFTPCVFPMIPILSGIIVGEGDNISASRGFMLALVYVLAMAFAYTIVGVLAGLFGSNLQIWFQNPWILGSFAVVFVLLSLSMFGFYELQMPSSIQGKLSAISNNQGSGKMMSAAIMGLLSALIVGPCVTAPLIGALIYIGQTGDAVLGGMALFALSMGMGAPLLVLGASAGKLLPKAGAWMDTIKSVFGVLLLGVAIWLLERVIPASASLFLWGMLLVVSGIYMGALHHPSQASKWYMLWKGLGVVVLLYGSLMIIGAAADTRNTLQPLKGMFASNASSDTAKSELEFHYIKGPQGFNDALAQATADGKTVMLDFYADWCISCKEMEAYTFSDPAVQKTLKNTVLLKSDVTANNEQDKALLKQFGLIGPPAILFFDKDGKERKGYRVVGFVPAEKFAPHAQDALN
jgi:thiol:disulfide interchange protein DsbD